ncbi:putative pleckstrin domain-containing protein [Rosa chinensis]|uniref:Putative pleckstrin domain-containing protein n=1 Tax=Rosa chinensis TaxID=74649 RepID=A0A2P6Q1J3_ROSCH|nr:putative pleckstrin domain-containing protein [Rosa chinensis]
MYLIEDTENEKKEWINSIRRSLVQHFRSLTDYEVVDYDNCRLAFVRLWLLCLCFV